MMLHLQKTGELSGEQAVPVCSTPLTLSSAFELLVSLCDNCAPNMKLLVTMLTDMFYTGLFNFFFYRNKYKYLFSVLIRLSNKSYRYRHALQDLRQDIYFINILYMDLFEKVIK